MKRIPDAKRLLPRAARELKLWSNYLTVKYSPEELESDVPLILDPALRVVRLGCQDVGRLLARGRPETALMIARPILESSLHVLWASRASNGWARLISYYAQDRIKHRDKLCRLFPAIGPLPADQRAILSDRMKDGVPMRSDPLVLLRDIEGADRRWGHRMGPTFADQTKSSFYGFLDPIAHGNLDILSVAQDADEVAHCHFICDWAALNAIRAVCYECNPPDAAILTTMKRWLAPYEHSPRQQRTFLRALVRLTGGHMFVAT